MYNYVNMLCPLFFFNTLQLSTKIKSSKKSLTSAKYKEKGNGLIFGEFSRATLMEQNPSSSTNDRKTTEKNRRNHMKSLYSKLHSLIPSDQISREAISLPDQLEGAANYIKKLQKEAEEMKKKKASLMGVENPINEGIRSRASAPVEGLNLPQIEVREMGSALEVVLVTGLDCQFTFRETIRVLHEEGAEVVNASFFAVDDHTVFHTIHSKVGESGLECGAAGLTERLKKFVF